VGLKHEDGGCIVSLDISGFERAFCLGEKRYNMNKIPTD
jgi:hypothetical protein